MLQADGALCPFEVEALPCGGQADLPGEGQAQEAPGILEREAPGS